jgi:hypothetical protein
MEIQPQLELRLVYLQRKFFLFGLIVKPKYVFIVGVIANKPLVFLVLVLLLNSLVMMKLHQSSVQLEKFGIVIIVINVFVT